MCRKDQTIDSAEPKLCHSPFKRVVKILRRYKSDTKQISRSSQVTKGHHSSKSHDYHVTHVLYVILHVEVDSDGHLTI